MFEQKIIDDVLRQLKFNDDGLIPAIAQDYQNNQVLMMAWMNKEAIAATLREGAGIYYSRSRQKLWRKGETSGHLQKLHAFYFDCDGDTIILKIEQTGPACHTNHRSCFFNQVTHDGLLIKEDN